MIAYLRVLRRLVQAALRRLLGPAALLALAGCATAGAGQCASWDAARRTWGGVAAGSAALAGAGGLGSVAVGDAARQGVALTSAGVAAIAAAAAWIADDYAAGISRECAAPLADAPPLEGPQ